MVVTLTFDDIGGGKTDTPRGCGTGRVEDREAHEKMGFHEGWGIATDQMEALAKTI